MFDQIWLVLSTIFDQLHANEHVLKIAGLVGTVITSFFAILKVSAPSRLRLERVAGERRIR